MKKIPEIDGEDRMMIVGFVLGALVFLMTLGRTPYPFSWAVKTIPIACLALAAFRHFPGRARWFMGLGFVFSGLGDILLELPRTALLFEAGMGAFILAHLCYVCQFIRQPVWVPARGVLMAMMAGAAGTFIVFLFPRLGEMALPILVYFSVILAMGVSTCLGRDNHWTAMAGAVLFILSDSLISLNMFVFPVPNSDFWIMATYYPAQALLAAGVWYSRKEKISGANPQRMSG